MIRNLFCLMLLCSALTGWGQTRTEEANRAVLNRIEFFINQQMTDSIYHLASESFQEKVSMDQLAFMLHSIYSLGRITDVQIEDFKGQTGTYRISFTEGSQLLAELAIDSTYRYHTFSFLPIEHHHTNTVNANKDEDISPIVAISPTELFIDSVANSYIKKANTQSMAIALFHNNTYKTFFYGEMDNGETPSEHTLYEIGSITKLFTATMLADLVVKGRIQLDDSIVHFLPDSVASNPALKGITFKNLANHTSGLPRMAENWKLVPDYDEKDPFAAYDRKALFSYLKNYESLDEPGEAYAYSNLGYGILGELISIIGDKSYMDQLQEIILTPLQLQHTTVFPDVKKQQVLLHGVDQEGNSTPMWHWQAMVGAGGLKSTIRDLASFAVEQFKMPENDLQKAMALTRQFTVFTPENMDIGLAWRISMIEDGIIYLHHTGATGGSNSFIGLSPDTKTVVIVLSNASESVQPISTMIIEKLLAD